MTRNLIKAAIMAVVLSISASGAAMAADAPAAAHADKLAVVDVDALLAKSKAGTSIQTQINKQRDAFRAQLAKPEKELSDEGKKLQDDISNRNTPEFNNKLKAFETKRAAYQKQAQEKGLSLENAARAANIELRKSIVKVVADIADKEHYTMVVTRDNVVIAEKDMDITEKVMAQLDKDLPDVKLKLETVKVDAPAAAPVKK